MKTRIALLLTMALLVTASILSAPRNACADCTCRGMSDGPTFTGTGDSCTTAQSNLRSQGLADARADCSPFTTCSTALNITTACYFDSASQTYKIGGYMHYGCWVC
ncbi:MAG: hypothetical protein ACJ76N_09400 [Thermoanaerobaculia bacterium]